MAEVETIIGDNGQQTVITTQEISAAEMRQVQALQNQIPRMRDGKPRGPILIPHIVVHERQEPALRMRDVALRVAGLREANRLELLQLVRNLSRDQGLIIRGGGRLVGIPNQLFIPEAPRIVRPGEAVMLTETDVLFWEQRLQELLVTEEEE